MRGRAMPFGCIKPCGRTACPTDRGSPCGARRPDGPTGRRPPLASADRAHAPDLRVGAVISWRQSSVDQALPEMERPRLGRRGRKQSGPRQGAQGEAYEADTDYHEDPTSTRATRRAMDPRGRAGRPFAPGP
jgi:hypothetical protein